MCDPAVNVDTVSDAPPATSGEVPRGVAPSKNSTDPVGVPGSTLADTVASSSTSPPTADGFGVELSVVVVDWSNS